MILYNAIKRIFLHSHSYSFRTTFTDRNLYCIKGALAWVSRNTAPRHRTHRVPPHASRARTHRVHRAEIHAWVLTK